MLTELCQELRNWFDRERYTGTFTIESGILAVSFLKEGQYYRIVGSLFNDGVHCYGDVADELVDETWDGSIWALAIPQPVIKLSAEIEAWREKYEKTDSAAMSPYSSESFGGYSYSKGGSSTGGPMIWKSVFGSRMNAWRKL